jgi:hypothetical protein
MLLSTPRASRSSRLARLRTSRRQQQPQWRWPARFFGFLLHYGTRLNAGCQAKALEARRHFLERFTHSEWSSGR